MLTRDRTEAEVKIERVCMKKELMFMRDFYMLGVLHTYFIKFQDNFKR